MLRTERAPLGVPDSLSNLREQMESGRSDSSSFSREVAMNKQHSSGATQIGWCISYCIDSHWPEHV